MYEERQTWMMAMAATLMGGKSVSVATAQADQAVAAFKARFGDEAQQGNREPDDD